MNEREINEREIDYASLAILAGGITPWASPILFGNCGLAFADVDRAQREPRESLPGVYKSKRIKHSAGTDADGRGKFNKLFRRRQKKGY